MRYLTAGEIPWASTNSHHRGVPAGLPLSEEDINKELKRRQGGYGRGARMKIERPCRDHIRGPSWFDQGEA